MKFICVQFLIFTRANRERNDLRFIYFCTEICLNRLVLDFKDVLVINSVFARLKNSEVEVNTDFSLRIHETCIGLFARFLSTWRTNYST